MSHFISLGVLEIECEDFKWDGLVRQYAVEGRQRDGFLIAGRPELVMNFSLKDGSPMRDAIGYARAQGLRKFKEALWRKYRIGEEFRDDPDHDEVWEKIYQTAQAAAQADGSGFIGIEIYYWVTLQLLREARGELLDKTFNGKTSRLGRYMGMRESLPDSVKL